MMKKGILIMLMAGTLFSECLSQENEKSNLTVGFNMGMDYNFNAYRMTEDDNGFTYYGMNPNLSFAVDFGYNVSRRFKPRFEVEYFYLKYGTNWNYGEESDFDKTITTVSYLGLNLHLDYGLILGDRFQVYLSPGLITDLAVNRTYDTYFNNSDDHTNAEYNVLSEQYPKALMGVSLSTPLAFKIKSNLKLTMEPEFTYFPYNFLKINEEPYTRISFKVGLQHTF